MKRNPSIIQDLCPELIQNTDEALIKIGQRFSNVSSIYYPCCSIDRRIEKAFPNAKIIFLDIDGSSFKQSVSKGNISVIADANEYISEKPVDLVFLFNPVIFPYKLEDNIKLQGLVVTNNYHGSARILNENPNFRLIGCEDLVKGWISGDVAQRQVTKVETVEQWQRLRPESYEKMQSIRQITHSKFSDIFGEDNKALDMISWHKRIVNIIIEFEKQEDGYMISPYRDITFKPLPTKDRAWTLDSLYVFEKIS